MRSVAALDATAMHFMEQFYEKCQKKNITLILSHVNEQPMRSMQKAGFDKVLKAVQETAKEQVGRFKGCVVDVLVEEVNEHDSSLMTGRMSNNTLVHFPGEVSLIGKIVAVELQECHGFYYTGSLKM